MATPSSSPTATFPVRRLAGAWCGWTATARAELLDAMLRFFPLDTYVDAPVTLMEVVPGDSVETPIWDEYARIVQAHEPGAAIDRVERFRFYALAREAYCVVQTGESAQYANILLKKGVVKS